jgi:hypothetical protein
MLDAAYGMLAMLPLALSITRVPDGVAATAGRHSPTDEPESSTIDLDARSAYRAKSRFATLVTHLRARRAQKRRELKEFRAWLAITREPLR